MIKISTKKYIEIQAIIDAMEIRQLTILGFMGMARTITLLNRIASHADFIAIDEFEIFIREGVKKILYDEFLNDIDIKRGLDVCNSLISNLEDYDYSDCIDKQDEDIMGIAYSIIEEWYYFIGLISENLQNENCKKFGKFITVPIICIDSYLCNKYDGMGTNMIVQEKVNNDILIKKEIAIINDDIAYVSIKSNLENNKITENRILNYIKYNILS